MFPMTAAEALEALDEALTGGPWYVASSPLGAGEWIMCRESDGSPWKIARFPSVHSEAPDLANLRNALPQLVAVVEAAEDTPHDPALCGRPGHCPGCIADAALTDLTAALEGDANGS